MMRSAVAALFVVLVLAGTGAGQGTPFEMPQPLGGPIVGPDGKIITGLDRAPQPWAGGFEFGLSGSDGNVDILKLRTGIDVRYDDSANFFVLNGLYVLTRLDDGIVEQKALLTARDELPVVDALAWYAQGQLEYDEFRVVNFRLAAHNGLSYTLLRGGNTVFKVRSGLGTSREYGGSSDDWVPEAQFGADFEYRLTARTSFYAAADYYPYLSDFSHYRVRARAAFDILLDPDLNLLLRIGVMDRFDSQPFGARKNDLDYFTSLVFHF